MTASTYRLTKPSLFISTKNERCIREQWMYFRRLVSKAPVVEASLLGRLERKSPTTGPFLVSLESFIHSRNVRG